jgi:CysZ protein
MSGRKWEQEPALGVGDGLGAFLGGVGFVIATPGVWLYALVPVTVLMLLACGGCVGGAWGAWETAFHFIGREAGAWKQVEGWLLTVGLAVLFVVLGLLAALALAQPLSGFALDAISHAQEKALTGRASPKPPVLASAWNALKVALFAFLLGAPVLVVLTVIGILFPPAVIVTIPLKVLVCGWMLAWDFVDYPLTMRDLGLGARLAWVGRHFLAFTTFGVLWAVLVVVPGLVLLLLPMGVAGATQLVVMADRAGRNEPQRHRDTEKAIQRERES